MLQLNIDIKIVLPYSRYVVIFHSRHVSFRLIKLSSDWTIESVAVLTVTHDGLRLRDANKQQVFMDFYSVVS